MNEFLVIICGSRSFTDYERLAKMCDYYLSRRIQEGQKVIIISGGADGADKLGERYATERGLDYRVFPADWDRYGKRAGMIRNAKMAEIANACIAFPSDYSENRGTNNMIKVARRNNLLVRVVEDEG